MKINEEKVQVILLPDSSPKAKKEEAKKEEDGGKVEKKSKSKKVVKPKSKVKGLYKNGAVQKIKTEAEKEEEYYDRYVRGR